MITSKVNVFKNSSSNIILKSGEVLFSIFDENFLEVIKEVDRPFDYYFMGDEITFKITVRNNGDKSLSNISITDILPDEVEPINEEYEVNFNLGTLTRRDNEITISDVSLAPNEELIIEIKGKIVDDSYQEIIKTELYDIDEESNE